MIGRAAFAAGLVLVAWMYLHRINDSPPHVEIDEVLIALDANAIATTGRDLRGEVLPLYSQTAEHSWYQPFVIYATALAVKLMPFSVRTIRLPTVVVGVASIVLMYFVARGLSASELIAAIAAGLLALSPAHFIHSRYGMDYLYPVPFVLAWLLCLLRYDRGRTPAERERWAAAAAAVLGVGFYSYISSIVMMPLYLGLTCLFLRAHGAPRRHYVVVGTIFGVLIVPFVVWLARHPGAYSATVVKYGLYDPDRVGAVRGLRSILSYESVSDRLSHYWNFFNPSFLFFGSGTKLMFSTNRAGVFLLPAAIFMAIGIYRAARDRASAMTGIVLAGFATAPVAALIVPEERAIFRALAIVPFGILLAAIGVRHLWSSPGRHRAWRLALVVLLLALVPAQFARFWSDYFSDYRVRSAYWLGGNIGGALQEAIDQTGRPGAPGGGVPRVYFSTLKSSAGQVDGRDQYMDAYWKFYLTMFQRQDLLERTARFEPSEAQAAPRGSLVIANLGDPAIEALVARGELTRIATIPELDGTSFFTVLRR